MTERRWMLAVAVCCVAALGAVVASRSSASTAAPPTRSGPSSPTVSGGYPEPDITSDRLVRTYAYPDNAPRLAPVPPSFKPALTREQAELLVRRNAGIDATTSLQTFLAINTSPSGGDDTGIPVWVVRRTGVEVAWSTSEGPEPSGLADSLTYVDARTGKVLSTEDVGWPDRGTRVSS
jgi:hypothetical protein